MTRSGVPGPTLHHWLRLGLLPAPLTSDAHRNSYDDRHVRAARLVRLLRERRGLSLDEIATILPSLLEADEAEAFRPEMWTAAMAAHVRRVQPAEPPPELLDAAVSAFGRLGYAEVRVEDVCVAAGMAKGSFYRWFESKGDAYDAAIRHVGTRVDAELREKADPGSPEEALSMLADAVGPHLALLLEAGSRAVRGDPGTAAALVATVRGIERTLSCLPGFGRRDGGSWLETVFGRAGLSAVGITSPRGAPA